MEEPDKGYAWIIVIAAFAINMILSGMARMIGFLYVDIIEVYRVTREEASLPFIVRNAIRYLAGPLVSVMGKSYGIRAVSFYGGLLAAAGSVLTCFSPNVSWIVFFWGGIHGLGFAMASTLYPVVVNEYFERHRATASGIVLSGACIGCLVFPLLLETILDTYGVFGCFLILGGLFLNVMPAALLLKSPPWVENPEEYARKTEGANNPTLVENYGQRHSKSSFKNTQKSWTKDYSFCQLDVSTLSELPRKKLHPAFGARKFELKAPKKSKAEDEIICTLYSVTKPSSKERTLYESSHITVNSECNKQFASSISVADAQEVPSDAPSAMIWNTVEALKDIAQLYTNPMYILINLNMAIYFWCFLPMVTVVVDYGRDRGVKDSNMKYLVHSLTVGDLIGRLCFGWVTDSRLMTFLVFMTFTVALQGLFLAGLPLTYNWWLYLLAVGLYGAASGTVFVHLPVLVRKYLKEKDQSMGIGCIGMVSGLVTFGVPPLIGYYRDNIGSYDGLFYIIGLSTVASSPLWLLEPIFLRAHLREEG